MADFRLSKAAAAALEAIYLYTDRTFGSYQADAYTEGLHRTFSLLADFPRMGQSADDISPGLLRFSYQSHVIFYRIEEDHIVIGNIIHSRRDFARQFKQGG